MSYADTVADLCAHGHDLTVHARRYTRPGGRVEVVCTVCERNRNRRRRDRERGREYGLTREQWQAMYDTQSGLCACCCERPVEVTDHDHNTGRVRGLLCHRCNRAIGLLGDTPEALERALAYVRGLG